MFPNGDPIPKKRAQPQSGDIARRKGTKQRRLPLRMVCFTISRAHLADRHDNLAEMMAPVAYKPQQAGEKSIDSESLP